MKAKELAPLLEEAFFRIDCDEEILRLLTDYGQSLINEAYAKCVYLENQRPPYEYSPSPSPADCAAAIKEMKP